MSGRRETVYFRLDPEDWHGRSNEGLWAEPVGDSANAFRLLNTPFFTRGVSFLDTVRVGQRTDGPGLEFAGIVDRGGHSTYMLLVPPNGGDFDAHWGKLQGLGCTYESKTIQTSLGQRVLYAVDVPGTSDIYAVYSTLEEGERMGVWIFQKGHVGHKLRSER